MLQLKNLLMKVQGYATRRRLEANIAKNKGDPMNITAVNDGWGTQDEWNDEWENQWETDIDAIGKGFK